MTMACANPEPSLWRAAKDAKKAIVIDSRLSGRFYSGAWFSDLVRSVAARRRLDHLVFSSNLLGEPVY
jgi:hypothetical protein